MKISKPIVQKIFAAAVVFSVYFLYFLNTSTPSLWFDEAGQFWISQGLNHDSLPDQQRGMLIDVIKNNRFYNMDPGGFSVLLHYWTMASKSILWLKTLPMLFFSLACIFYFFCIYSASKNILSATLLTTLPIIFPSTSSMGYELRAYSMEMLGTVLCAYLLIQLNYKITNSKLFLTSLAFSFFSFSRYAEILVIFSASIYVGYLVSISQNSVKRKIQSLIIYTAPLLISIGLIYYLSMRFQNPRATNLFYLSYLKQNPSILLSYFNICYISFLIALSLITFKTWSVESFKNFKPIFCLTLLTNFVFMISSFLGLQPWSPDTKYGISCGTLSLLSVSLIISEFTARCFNSKLLRFLPFAILTFLIFNASTFLPFTKWKRSNEYYSFIQIINETNAKFYVDRTEAPYVRYLFEIEAPELRKQFNYPANFTFQPLTKHSDWIQNRYSLQEVYKDRPKMNELTQYDILVTPELYNLGNNDKWEAIKNTSGFFRKK